MLLSLLANPSSDLVPVAVLVLVLLLARRQVKHVALVLVLPLPLVLVLPQERLQDLAGMLALVLGPGATPGATGGG